MRKILYTDCTFTDQEISKLRLKGFDIVPARPDLNEQELIKALADIEIYILGGVEIATEKVINAAQNLKLLCFFGAGYGKHVDIEAAARKKIPVTYTPGANAGSVAEHTVALILNLVKKITVLNNSTKQGKWDKIATWNLQGKTVGIIGLGNVGQNVARILHNGFNMDILYVSKTPKSAIEKELNAAKASLRALLERSDVVSIHAPYAKETIGMIGKKELDLMKKEAVLINTARAELVDPKALYDALITNKISSVAFDCYYKEPFVSLGDDTWKLLSLPDDKFLVTPHNAYNSPEAVKKMNEMILESIFSYLENKKPKYHI